MAKLNVIAKIVPRSEHFEEARSAISGIVDRTRAESGCIEFRLSEDPQAGTLHLYEEWRDEAALAEHHAQPYTSSVFKAYESRFAEEPEILHLRPVE
ncbi:antibiotic biosynthesis monooxygenase [Erythrobacter sp. HI0019]|uniref:putative quinol monooxygenase n=1 Tax=unclassified Erythrobacter TaxID=2633097 RepID=UPI0007BA91F5|nr:MULTISPECIES: putative quinol monooxygenase [unclassified Erythrobacter]KZX94855.1 antibiotic biosynthesis monooxygenase [Erythrobacter sp. HI0019]KZY09065.1 antibiotic biosynthesis monooxygenase [Erythrobacter sp. HI0028]